MDIQKTIKDLKAQYGCPIWISSKGELIPLRLMKDSYLLNCQRVVKEGIAREYKTARELTSPLEPIEDNVEELLLVIERLLVYKTWERLLDQEAKGRELKPLPLRTDEYGLVLVVPEDGGIKIEFVEVA